ncbi:PEP-CTERM sorting domain-containing protein [Microcystis aeruginosa CS-564/01]|uniref:PEP-CTERM sorting domain-containing protein n=1 Tax=Microcystis aeruginosa TaxID=1126 RepID=UPI00232C8754|nr:PEP-CTERM sorting domain-containing protein [Microcystis aeruginosa]MDB9424543.1 PEP-CTERM sorting domain-containing protein [Microcystis aeruginosa CS-564/01]
MKKGNRFLRLGMGTAVARCDHPNSFCKAYNMFSHLSKIRSRILLSLILIISFPKPAFSTDIVTLIELAALLKDFFAPAPINNPKITANNDPCFVKVDFTGLGGVYGNGKFPATQFDINEYWQGSLEITHSEGFTKRDRLQITATIQHKNDLCDKEIDPALGPAFTYLINADLNEPTIQSKISDRGDGVQLHMSGSKGPELHISPNHYDSSSYSLTANVFDPEQKTPPANYTEIGLYALTLRANHTTTPEPSAILSLLALGTLGAASTLKRQLKPSKSTEKETTKVG